MIRLKMIKAWLTDYAGLKDYTLTHVPGGASSRRYFRVTPADDEISFILMDVPPHKEPTANFVNNARMLRGFGLNVPEIISNDPHFGFVLMTDFGDKQYLSEFNLLTYDKLYDDALDALITLQAKGASQIEKVSAYTYDRMIQEMNLFRLWFAGEIDATQERVLGETFDFLATEATNQPYAMIHRDYQSTNLMVTGRNDPGILDFQDLMTGPVAFDVVSLLRDSYISLPREQVERKALAFLRTAQIELPGFPVIAASDRDLLRWFDLVGMQRHLTSIGIFARLSKRDKKTEYIKHIPRTLGYITDVCGKYSELEEFNRTFNT